MDIRMRFPDSYNDLVLLDTVKYTEVKLWDEITQKLRVIPVHRRGLTYVSSSARFEVVEGHGTMFVINMEVRNE